MEQQTAVNNQAEQASRTIRFYARNVYGVTKFYAVDYAYEIGMLTGNKTLTPLTFSCLEALGFQFTEVLDPERTQAAQNQGPQRNWKKMFS